MRKLTSILTETVEEAFASCGYDRDLGSVSVSDRMDLCQFQCNGAFAGAKRHRKAPLMIASDVATVLKNNPMFSKAEAVAPAF